MVSRDAKPKFTKLGNKCQLARSLMVQNFVTLLKELCEISTVENLCSRKSGPKITKISQDLLRTNAPHCAKFHRTWPKDVWEKCYKIFLHPTVFWRPRGPSRSKFTNLDIEDSLDHLAKFRALVTIYLRDKAAELRWFCQKRDQQTDKDSKRYASTYNGMNYLTFSISDRSASQL